jgi:hypothetical protein
MKIALTFLATLLITTGAMASDLACKSEMYSIVIPRIENFSYASYYVAEEMSRGVDQSLIKLDVTDRLITFTITSNEFSSDYDSQIFDISVEKVGAKTYKGTITSGAVIQEINCTREID